MFFKTLHFADSRGLRADPGSQRSQQAEIGRAINGFSDADWNAKGNVSNSQILRTRKLRMSYLEMEKVSWPRLVIGTGCGVSYIKRKWPDSIERIVD